MSPNPKENRAVRFCQNLTRLTAVASMLLSFGVGCTPSSGETPVSTPIFSHTVAKEGWPDFEVPESESWVGGLEGIEIALQENSDFEYVLITQIYTLQSIYQNPPEGSEFTPADQSFILNSLLTGWLAYIEVLEQKGETELAFGFSTNLYGFLFRPEVQAQADADLRTEALARASQAIDARVTELAGDPEVFKTYLRGVAEFELTEVAGDVSPSLRNDLESIRTWQAKDNYCYMVLNFLKFWSLGDQHQNCLSQALPDPAVLRQATEAYVNARIADHLRIVWERTLAEQIEGQQNNLPSVEMAAAEAARVTNHQAAVIWGLGSDGLGLGPNDIGRILELWQFSLDDMRQNEEFLQPDKVDEIQIIMTKFLFEQLRISGQMPPMSLPRYIRDLDENGLLEGKFDDIGYRDEHGRLTDQGIAQISEDLQTRLGEARLNLLLQEEPARLMAKWLTQTIREGSMWISDHGEVTFITEEQMTINFFDWQHVHYTDLNKEASAWVNNPGLPFNLFDKIVPILHLSETGEIVVSHDLALPSLFPNLLLNPEQLTDINGVRLVAFKQSPDGPQMVGAVLPEDWERIQAMGIAGLEQIHELTVKFPRYGPADKQGEWSSLTATIELPRNDNHERIGEFLFIVNVQDERGNFFPAVLFKHKTEDLDEYLLVTGKAPGNLETDESRYLSGQLEVGTNGSLSFVGKIGEHGHGLDDDPVYRLRLVVQPSGPYSPGLIPIEQVMRQAVDTFAPNGGVAPDIARAFSLTERPVDMAIVNAVAARGSAFNPLGKYQSLPEMSVCLMTENNILPLGLTGQPLPVSSFTVVREPEILDLGEAGKWLVLFRVPASTDVERPTITTGWKFLDDRTDQLFDWLAGKNILTSGTHTDAYILVPYDDAIILTDRESAGQKFYYKNLGLLLSGLHQAIELPMLLLPIGWVQKLLQLGIPVTWFASSALYYEIVEEATSVEGGRGE